MENYDPSKAYSSIALRNAVIGSLILIVLGLIVYLTGLNDNNAMQWTSSLLSLAVLIYIIRQSTITHRDDIGGYITYGRAFSVAMLTIFFMGLIMAVWSFIQMTFITPDLLEQTIEAQRMEFEDRGMSEEEIDTAMKFAGMFQSPAVMAVAALFGYLFFGLIISLITSAVLKKDPPAV